MNVKTRIAVLSGALALMAPTTALAAGAPEYEVDTPPKHPGPGATMPEKAKAYGVYCRGFSKQHVAGQKGTPFSDCVTAMARAATTKKTARQVCVGFAKTHVAGRPGTPFSDCVGAAAKVKRQTA